MNLYAIDRSIENLIAASVDEETGELLIDMEELEALSIERDKKIENIALYIKNLKAEAQAIREEERNLAARRKSAENYADRLVKLLSSSLNGEKFSTPRVNISYRTSTALEVNEKFYSWANQYAPELLRQKQAEADKKAITDAIKSGKEIPWAEIVSKINLTIK